MYTDSRKILQRLKKEGWTVIRIAGSHHVLQHPGRPYSIVLPHPRKDLPIGLVRAIYRQAGWR